MKYGHQILFGNAMNQLSLFNQNYKVHTDEAITIITRFVDFTIKEYCNPYLRFSLLSKEREYWETARDFVEGYTAIEWGDVYYSLEDMVHIIFSDIDISWFCQRIQKMAQNNIDAYINNINNKKSNKNTPQIYLTGDNQIKASGWCFAMNKYLQELNVTVVEARDILCDEVQDNDPDQYVQNIRYVVDYNMSLIDRSDIVVLKWHSFSNLEDILHEITHAYNRLVRIYTITSIADVTNIPPLLLAYTTKFFRNQNLLLDNIRTLAGKKIVQ